MITKVSTRFTKRFQRAESIADGIHTYREIIPNTLAIPAYVLALAKTGRPQREMLLCADHSQEPSVTLWSPRERPLRFPDDVLALNAAERMATRMVVEIDTGVTDAIIKVTMLFMPSGKNVRPIIGVLGAVESIGVRVLRLMKPEELPNAFLQIGR